MAEFELTDNAILERLVIPDGTCIALILMCFPSEVLYSFVVEEAVSMDTPCDLSER